MLLIEEANCPDLQFDVPNSDVGDIMDLDELEGIRTILTTGLHLSGQGSYSRRAPANEAIPFLQEACSELLRFVKQYPASAEAWKLLALGFEAQLDYRRAVDALQMYLKLAPNASKKDHKRLVQCRQCLHEWNLLCLTPEEFRQLGNYLHRTVSADSAGDFRHTLAWLNETGHRDPQAVLQGLRNRGALDDWQVLHNIANG